MRLAVVTFAILMVLAMAVQAEFPDTVSQALLFNQFRDFKLLNNYAIATTEDAIVTLWWQDSEGKFALADYVLTATRPGKIKLFDSWAVIRSDADLLHFVSLDSIPHVHVDQVVAVNESYLDYAVCGDQLYLARGFDGLWQYELDGSSYPSFVDSSLAGTHVIDLVVDDSVVIALDDYNGLYSYLVQPDAPLLLYDSLLIDQQMSAVEIDQNLLMVWNTDLGVIRTGQNVSGQMSLDVTLESLINPKVLYHSGKYLCATQNSGSGLQVWNLETDETVVLPTPRLREEFSHGDIGTGPYENRLFVPVYTSGLTTWVLDSVWHDSEFGEGYARPGPISAIHMTPYGLITAGNESPIDIYDAEADDNLHLQYTQDVVSEFTELAYCNGRAFALSPTADALYALRNFPEFELHEVMELDVTPFGDMQLHYQPESDTYYLFLVHGLGVLIYEVNEDDSLEFVESINVIGTVSDLQVLDDGTLLTIATTKRYLYFYSIGLDGAILPISTLLGGPPVTEVIECRYKSSPDSSVFVAYTADARREIIFDQYGATLLPSEPIPFSVYDAFVTDSVIWTVGDDGVGLLEVADGLPIPVVSGGYPGDKVTASDSHVVTTDGRSIMVYSLADGIPTEVADPDIVLPDKFYLSQNYPNPFNPSTTISFNLPGPMFVELEVLDILGRRVKTLFSGKLSGGNHEVVWDGTGRSGESVATGVYLYRLRSETFSASRKMLLVK